MKPSRQVKTATTYPIDVFQENDMENKTNKAESITKFMGATSGRVVCVIAILIAAVSTGYAGYDTYSIIDEEQRKDKITLDENGDYNSKEDVAAYIYKYDHLPDNYITKQEAQTMGWIGGPVSDVAPGKSIGGDRFYTKNLGNEDIADAEGRYYIECDVNTDGKDERGSERLIYSNDGLVYYTNDHYETFELAYGEEVLREFN